MLKRMLVLAIFSITFSAYGTNYYVDPNGNDYANGLSWATAFETIQKAINTATGGDIIDVNEGIYNENIDFKGKMITLNSTDAEDPAIVASTIIDANNTNSAVITFNTGEDGNSILKGFTIKGGARGIYCDNTSPSIKNCIITSNGDESTPVSSPLLYWKMNDNTGNATVVDISGNSKNGIFYDTSGDPNTDAHDTTGEIDGALNFDGNDDYIRTSAINQITKTGTYTVAAWVKYASSDTRRTIIQNALSNSDRNAMSIYYGIARFGYYDGTSWTGKSGSLSNDEWHFLVGINNAGTLSFYIDNVEQTGSSTPYCGVDASYCYVGKSTTGGHYFGVCDCMHVCLI